MSDSEKKDSILALYNSIPYYEDLCASPLAAKALEDSVVEYAHSMNAIPTFGPQPDEHDKARPVTLAAPYIENNSSNIVTEEEFIAGVCINIPRSPKLWAGDQLRVMWGPNVFYSEIPVSSGRDEPRLTHTFSCEHLATYENGEIEVRYQVLRRSRLVGVSKPLKLTVRGSKNRPKSPGRLRSVRRLKLRE